MDHQTLRPRSFDGQIGARQELPPAIQDHEGGGDMANFAVLGEHSEKQQLKLGHVTEADRAL